MDSIQESQQQGNNDYGPAGLTIESVQESQQQGSNDYTSTILQNGTCIRVDRKSMPRQNLLLSPKFDSNGMYIVRDKCCGMIMCTGIFGLVEEVTAIVYISNSHC